TEDRLDRLVLGLQHAGRAAEGEDRLVDAGGLHHAAALGKVAVEDRQAAVGGVGVGDVADAAPGGVEVEGLPALRLREGGGAADAGGGGVEELDRLVGGVAAAQVPVPEPGVHRGRVHGVDAFVQEAAAAQLAEDRGD